MCVCVLYSGRRCPFMCWFEHVESRCGRMSFVLVKHSVRFRFGCIIGFFLFFFLNDGYPCIGHIKILAIVRFVCQKCWELAISGLRVCV